ncbi:MAG: hypothetical protein HQL24_08940 [Candidatus Omnitrophica bacterium]|nr:hypothetical protein [Candidatus Omnitrophota bacterium]
MKKLLLVFLILSLYGCSTVTYRKSPRFENYFDQSKTIGVISPGVKIYSLTAGGIDQYNDEWSIQSKEKILRLIKEKLETVSNSKVAYIDEKQLNESQKDLVSEQNGMFFTVAHSIIAHTYLPVSQFPYKVKNFDYTMGDEVGDLNSIANVDTLLFCSGRNYIWTTGRVSLSIFGALLGAATGVCVIVPAGPEWIVLSLVDAKTGEVIWFNYKPMPGDLRNEDVDKKIIDELFKDFPEKWRGNK